MNKLIIFDLDGVLIDSRELHFNALNDALAKIAPSCVISREEHLSIFDGLNTTRKLQMLTTQRGLPSSLYDSIWKAKQESTFDIIRQLGKNDALIGELRDLKSKGYLIAVASNSIRETVKLALIAIGVMEYIDYYVSNEDVKRPKPYPEMYWKCMTALNALPKNTVIFEDSHIGREGALNSGCHLVPIKDAHDMSHEKIQDALDILEGNKRTPIKWRDKKMNVLIPMAGAGSRFVAAGYTFPKPLIEVRGKPMIQLVTENLNIDAHFIYIVQKEHYEKYNIKQFLNLISPGCDIIQVDGLTEGAACTTLLAKELIDNDAPLLLANSDQFVEWNSNEVMYAFNADTIDGGILTFKATHPKWSYARLDSNGFASEVAEKKVISDNATVGIYFWKKGSDYVKYAEQMIAADDRTNNEFYICPIFNYAIRDGQRIRIKEIQKMWGIGTPEDLDYFLANYKGDF